MPSLEHQPPRLVSFAGKDSVGQRSAADILAEYDIMTISTWELLRQEAGSRRRVGIDREGLYSIIPEVHRRYRHPGALVLRALESWNRQRERFSGGLALLDVAIESEAWELKQHGGLVCYMDAPNELCYARIIQPKRVRFNVKMPQYYSFEDFVARMKEDYEGRPGIDYPSLRDIDGMDDFKLVNDSSRDKLRSTLVQELDLSKRP